MATIGVQSSFRNRRVVFANPGVIPTTPCQSLFSMESTSNSEYPLASLLSPFFSLFRLPLVDTSAWHRN
eukprot:scaffold5026_cov173-Cylindrotheca_fusiformis.AAC.2